MTVLRELELRVARGAAALDQHVPGWRERVDARTLDVGSGDACVLGQLFGRYDSEGAERFLAHTSLRASQLGFDARAGSPLNVFTILTSLWKQEVYWKPRSCTTSVDERANTLARVTP